MITKHWPISPSVSKNFSKTKIKMTKVIVQETRVKGKITSKRVIENNWWFVWMVRYLWTISWRILLGWNSHHWRLNLYFNACTNYWHNKGLGHRKFFLHIIRSILHHFLAPNHLTIKNHKEYDWRHVCGHDDKREGVRIPDVVWAS